MSNNINKEILKIEKKEKFLSKKLSCDLGWLNLIAPFSMFVYLTEFIPDGFCNITKSWLFNGVFGMFIIVSLLVFILMHTVYVQISGTLRAVLIFLVFHLLPVIYYLYIWTIY